MLKLGIEIYLFLFRQNVTALEEHKIKTGTQTIRQLVLSVIVTTMVLIGGSLDPSAAHGQTVKAFPTAEGFGANAKGGRGGRIIKVTNLNDSGTGSLRTALEATGPRIVVFDVSGTINLTSDIILRSANSYVTVAGQTSPRGIQVKGRGIYLYEGFQNGIFRHIRVRPGARATPQTQETNGLIIVGSTLSGVSPAQINDVIIDHCSIMWTEDDLAMTVSYATNITWQWCIFAEGIPDTVVSGGGRQAFAVGSQNDNLNSQALTLSMHHNLFIHNATRNPFAGRCNIMDFRNNLVFDWLGNNAFQLGQSSYGSNFTCRANFVNNVFIRSNNSAFNTFILGNGNGERGGTRIYTSGNWGPNCPGGCANDWNNGFLDEDTNWQLASESKYRVSTPFSTPVVTITPTGSLESVISATVGAYKPLRDSADQKMLNDLASRTGGFPTGTGGPWPTLTGGSPSTDTDGDGIPDSWEIARSLNPKDPSDGPRVAANGYTNIENYLNELAGDPIPGGSLFSGSPVGGGGSSVGIPPTPPNGLVVVPQ